MTISGSTSPIWIEAAINGPWGNERQPGIPIAIPDTSRAALTP